MDNITTKTQRRHIIELCQEEFLPSQSAHKLCRLILSREPEFVTGASLFHTELTNLVILWPCVLHFYMRVQFKSALIHFSTYSAGPCWFNFKAGMSKLFHKRPWGCRFVFQPIKLTQLEQWAFRRLRSVDSISQVWSAVAWFEHPCFKVWKRDTSCCLVWGSWCIYIYSEPAAWASNFSLDRCGCFALEQIQSLPTMSHLLNIPEQSLTSHSEKAIGNTWCLHVLPFSDSGFPSPVG